MAPLTLVNKPIGATGYGLMGLTWRPTHRLLPQDQSFACMRTALSLGANFWNGGELYGSPSRNSCHLLREYWTEHPEDADKVVLSIKGGLKQGQLIPDGSKANVRRSVEDCLKALGGTKKTIDIFQCARVDPNVPIEDTISALSELVAENKISGIGLSEVRSSTIARAHKVHPIAAVEVELSLWATDILYNGVVSTCSALGIPIVAYSPLSRGAFGGGGVRRNADLPDDDFRKGLPKFQDDVLEHNNRIVDEIEALAKRKGNGTTKAQIAVAWVRQLSGRKMRIRNAKGEEEECVLGVIIPIPGASSEERVRENCAVGVELSDGEMREMEELLGGMAVKGERYHAMGMKHAEG
jgi:pyridoxine 4-dehydrogenase